MTRLTGRTLLAAGRSGRGGRGFRRLRRGESGRSAGGSPPAGKRMTRLTGRTLLAAAGLALVVACGGIKDDPILRLSSSEALDIGKQLMADEKFSQALQHLVHAFEVEPNSETGREGLLLAADALFLRGGYQSYVEAEQRYRDFLNRFPTSERAAYAQFRLASALAERIEKPDRDQQTARQALSEFENVPPALPDQPVRRPGRRTDRRGPEPTRGARVRRRQLLLPIPHSEGGRRTLQGDARAVSGLPGQGQDPRLHVPSPMSRCSSGPVSTPGWMWSTICVTRANSCGANTPAVPGSRRCLRRRRSERCEATSRQPPHGRTAAAKKSPKATMVPETDVGCPRRRDAPARRPPAPLPGGRARHRRLQRRLCLDGVATRVDEPPGDPERGCPGRPRAT